MNLISLTEELLSIGAPITHSFDFPHHSYGSIIVDNEWLIQVSADTVELRLLHILNKNQDTVTLFKFNSVNDLIQFIMEN